MTRRWTSLLWPVLFAILAAAVYTTKIRREMADFDVYLRASHRAVAAEPLYRPDDGHYQFKYLPAFALAMGPWSLLQRETAKAVWFALSVGLLVAVVRWSVVALPARRRSTRLLGWLTVVFMAKFYAHELTLGQTNILLAALLLAALLAADLEHPRVAGLLVGAAAFVKPYALILVPWLAVALGPGAAAAAVGLVAAGLALPAGVYGWSGNLELLAGWWRTVTGSTAGSLLSADNVSIAAMWAKWLGPGAAAAWLAAATVVAAAGLVVAAWSWRRGVEEPAYLEFALLMLLVPLVSPQGWDYVLLLATPAVVCLVDRWRDLGPAWRSVSAAALAVMGLTFFDLLGRTLYGRFMMLSIVSVCALTISVALARLRWKALA